MKFSGFSAEAIKGCPSRNFWFKWQHYLWKWLPNKNRKEIGYWGPCSSEAAQGLEAYLVESLTVGKFLRYQGFKLKLLLNKTALVCTLSDTMSSLHPTSASGVQGAVHRDPQFFSYTSNGILSSWCIDSWKWCGQAQSWSTHISPGREGSTAEEPEGTKVLVTQVA